MRQRRIYSHVIRVVCVSLSLCGPDSVVCVRMSFTATHWRANGQPVLMQWSADQCKQSDHWSACPAVHSSHRSSGALSLTVTYCVAVL